MHSHMHIFINFLLYSNPSAKQAGILQFIYLYDDVLYDDDGYDDDEKWNAYFHLWFNENQISYKG